MTALFALYQRYDGPIPPAELAAAIKATVERVMPDPPHVIWRKCWRDAVERIRGRDARGPYVGRELRSYFQAQAEDRKWQRHCVLKYAETKPAIEAMRSAAE